MVNILIAGFVGGTVRGIVGFTKHQFSYKGTNFKLNYFLVMVFLSGIVGLIVGYSFGKNALLALVVGYAGSDFLENVYKTIKNK